MRFPPPTISRPDLTPEGSDAAFRRQLYRLIEASNRLAGFREGFGRQEGLTATQFLVLWGVAYAEPEGITVAGLAQAIGLAATHATTETGRLIRRGLMSKRPNEADRRSVIVALTPEGRAAVERLAPVVRGVNDILFDGITAAQLDAVLTVTERLIRNADMAELFLRRHEDAADADATPAGTGGAG